MSRAAVAVAVCALLAALAIVVEPAGASFPGTNGLIVLASAPPGQSGTTQGQLYTMHPDGTSFSALTHTPSSIENSDPSYSADGRRIVFVRTRWGRFKCGSSTVSGGLDSLMVMNSDGTGTRSVLSTPRCGGVQISFSDPVFSPDGRTIAVAVFDDIGLFRTWHTLKQNEQEIFQINTDGSHIRRLTFSSKVTGKRQPTGLTKLKSFTVNEQPAFSPDGRTILFTHQFDSVYPGCEPCKEDVYALDRSGHVHRLTYDQTDSTATFSPDGKRIVYTNTPRDELGDLNTPTGDVWLMDSNGAHRHLVCGTKSSGCLGCATSTHGGRVRCFGFSQSVFSPDGKRIAFFAHLRAQTCTGQPPGPVTCQAANAFRFVTINPDGSQPAIGSPIAFGRIQEPGYGRLPSLSWQPLGR